MAARLREQSPGLRVTTAYLERLSPGIDTVIDSLAAEGIKEIALLPVFWSAQGHVAHVVPEIRAKLDTVGVALQVLPVLSELPGLVDFVALQALHLAGEN